MEKKCAKDFVDFNHFKCYSSKQRKRETHFDHHDEEGSDRYDIGKGEIAYDA